MGDYPAFPKIPRLNRAVTVSEKIDGTNGLIAIEKVESDHVYEWQEDGEIRVHDVHGSEYLVRAGSRSKWLEPTKQKDNFGFAQWVQANAQGLVETLGEGLHYGEWWGSGIQRGYGLQKGEKRFSLFNTHRWGDADLSRVPGLSVVPVLEQYDGRDLNGAVERALDRLRAEGSLASPGFDKPEGVVVWHDAAQQYFKVLLEGDEIPKGVAA